VYHGPDPSDAEALLAWAYLSAEERNLPAALRYYAAVVRLRPENREALGGRSMALEALGAPFQAEILGREPPPGVLQGAEGGRVAETQSAMLLRWGRLPVADPARRATLVARAGPDVQDERVLRRTTEFAVSARASVRTLRWLASSTAARAATIAASSPAAARWTGGSRET